MQTVWGALYDLYGMPTMLKDDTRGQWDAATFRLLAVTRPRMLAYVIKDYAIKCEEMKEHKIKRAKEEL